MKSKILSLVISVIILTVFIVYKATADFYQDDNNGFWLQDFKNSLNLGLAPTRY